MRWVISVQLKLHLLTQMSSPGWVLLLVFLLSPVWSRDWFFLPPAYLHTLKVMVMEMRTIARALSALKLYMIMTNLRVSPRIGGGLVF